MLKLTEKLRKICSKPHGKLYIGHSIFKTEKLAKYKFLACVGDVVSYLSLKNNLKPKILIFDGKIKRERANDEFLDELKALSYDYYEIKVENPPSCLTEDLVYNLYKILEKLEKNRKKYKVFVKGEEDLSVIPLTIFMPENSAIIYGQPDEGVVLVNPKRDVKLKVYNIALQMRRVNSNGDRIIRLFKEVMNSWKFL